MSTDYSLVSPSNKMAVCVGSNGLSGVQSYPGHYSVVRFIAWAIENHVEDIILVDEHRLDAMMTADGDIIGWSERADQVLYARDRSESNG